MVSSNRKVLDSVSARRRLGERRVEKARDLNTPIPDDDPAGLVSRVFVPDEGRIVEVEVGVDIDHSYVGDLMVALTGPDGVRRVLHDRDGGAQSGLSLKLSSKTLEVLRDLRGAEAAGLWMLEVVDHAKIDKGTIEKWSLAVDIDPAPVRSFESKVGKMIPDDSPVGIIDVIEVTEDIPFSSVSVDVDITHTWIGDLVIELDREGHPTLRLHDRGTGSGSSLIRTWASDDHPELAEWLQGSASGEWVLKVSDHAGRDVGKWNRWSLRFR